eukprot:CAMPEP_0115681902 /NCGR_PEP_ID=MMETSP0272-20121206/57569_1 /TAXON_ID=71861 /ORGANISM="Scrippsiella trochoidea, Strain CCMP3099" /LENGTH=370 /DNA_ID=CAMNT_0003121243 /DNA_START=119 /DNA_END=1232 /DNA_ORIENTATION=-
MAQLEVLDETLQPPSRNRYPGSLRSDAPRRWRAYALRGGDHGEALARQEDKFLSGALLLAADPRCSLLCTPCQENMPEAPAKEQANTVHGVLFLGQAGSGKTSLIHSLIASLTGSYPKGSEDPWAKDGKDCSHVLPEACDFNPGVGKVPRRDGGASLVLTDTAPLEVEQHGSSEGAVAASLIDRRFAHGAVVMVVDALAKPLWEDPELKGRLACFIALLRQRGYTVVVAVTKLAVLRRQRYEKHVRQGLPFSGGVSEDSRSNYAEFVGRYLSVLCDALRIEDRLAKFPVIGTTVFDIPTWMNIKTWRVGAHCRGEVPMDVPNWTYTHSQLHKLLRATQTPCSSLERALPLPPVYRVAPLAGSYRKPWTAA